MFEFKGFTQKANRALNLAVEAAQNMGHRYVGTEHVLYGLAAEGSGVAAAALEQCGISAQSIQSTVHYIQLYIISSKQSAKASG